MIKWFRNATDFSKPKKQVQPATTPQTPKRPKTLAPKKLKKVFVGPKSPGAYKKKLYIPKKFITAAEGDEMSDEEMQALLNPTPEVSTEVPEEIEEETEFELTPEQTMAEEETDPVALALSTIPGLTRITYKATMNPKCCDWCTSLNGRTWPTVESFKLDKTNVAKPGTDHDHLAHPGCNCKLQIDTNTGDKYLVDTAGVPEKI